MKAEKKGRKRARKIIENGLWQKESKFWLMRVHRIEILHNFVPNLRDDLSFLVKNGFLAKLRLF